KEQEARNREIAREQAEREHRLEESRRKAAESWGNIWSDQESQQAEEAHQQELQQQRYERLRVFAREQIRKEKEEQERLAKEKEKEKRRQERKELERERILAEKDREIAIECERIQRSIDLYAAEIKTPDFS